MVDSLPDLPEDLSGPLPAGPKESVTGGHPSTPSRKETGTKGHIAGEKPLPTFPPPKAPVPRREKDTSCAALGHMFQIVSEWGAGSQKTVKMVCLKCGEVRIV